MNHHIIYRQKATVQVAKEAQAYAVQSEISDVMKNELPQLLQDVFDSISPGGDIIRIDSLHLDLGTLPEQNTGQVFKERVAEKIREAIVISKKNKTSESGTGTLHKQQSLREAFLYFLQTGIKPWFMGAKNRQAWENEMQQAFAPDDWKKITAWLRHNHQQQPVIVERLIHQFSVDFTNNVITLTISFDNERWKDVYQDLLHLYKEENKGNESKAKTKILRLCIPAFLKEASLPGALYHVVKELVDADATGTAMQSTGVINNFDRTIHTGIVNEVLATIRQEKYLLLKTRNERQDKADDNKITPENEGRNADIKSTNHPASYHDMQPENKEELSPDHTQSENRAVNQESDEQSLLDNIRNENTDADPAIADQHLLHGDTGAQNSKPPSKHIRLGSGNNNRVFKDSNRWKLEDKSRQITGYASDIKTGNEFINNKPDFSPVEERASGKWNDDKKPPQHSNRIPHKNIEDEPQYVSNCGIVLLHPFLETYLAEFALLSNRKFIDEDACRRAVLLLHYLATGETEGEEWNLLLQKMMCSLSTEETLPDRLDITDAEREETEKLLQSVISYCPPLKNTSVAGFRSTFLQREGRLEKKENGWLLTVEQKTVDMLLDKLPWGFSTIRLPWLKDIINIDWC